jgi:ferredoxin
MGLRVEVDATKCMGSGNCVFSAPNTFALGDDDVAHVLDPEGDPEEQVVAAAQRCPTQAITVSRDDA